MSPDDFMKALAQVESRGHWKYAIGNRDYLLLGDQGRALGKHQMWPVWVWSVATRHHIVPHQNETWEQYLERLLRAFYEFEAAQGRTPIQIGCYFHVGHPVLETDADWPRDYAAKLTAAFDEVTKKRP